MNNHEVPGDSQPKCVTTVFDDLHRLRMRQTNRFRVSNGSDDVTGLEMRRCHTSTSYLHRCDGMN